MPRRPPLALSRVRLSVLRRHHTTASHHRFGVGVEVPVRGRDHRTFAVGYSVNGNAMAALLCAPSATPLPTTGHDVWFDHGDNRPSTGGSVASDWAPGYYKGQCADNEYVAGVAYTWNWNDGGVPDALLCRPLS